ncbi:MAG: hypothetical protein O2U61_04510 [Candidatus Bathyarchaeota archaeon]|nr:hypothetical protein [Candidatus Bathyarchaeota archaeon]
MKKTSVAIKGDVIVMILVPPDFLADIDGLTKKISQVLTGIYKGAQKTGDKDLTEEAIRVLNQGIADSAKKVLQMLSDANEDH